MSISVPKDKNPCHILGHSYIDSSQYLKSKLATKFLFSFLLTLLSLPLTLSLLVLLLIIVKIAIIHSVNRFPFTNA